jgi:DNA mismatch repair protein MSH6
LIYFLKIIKLTIFVFCLELYERDADIGHAEFDLKLTDRVNMRMVGVPESAFEHWAAQFIAKG